VAWFDRERFEREIQPVPNCHHAIYLFPGHYDETFDASIQLDHCTSITVVYNVICKKTYWSSVTICNTYSYINYPLTTLTLCATCIKSGLIVYFIRQTQMLVCDLPDISSAACMFFGIKQIYRRWWRQSAWNFAQWYTWVLYVGSPLLGGNTLKGYPKSKILVL